MSPKHTSLIQMFAERAKRLYSPRAVAMEVLKLSHHPEVDGQKLTVQISHDPALSARVLRVVNSSLFAARDEIIDLDQAVALLGVKTLRMLVLGFAIPDSMFDEQYAKALSAYWRFTAIKAIAAKTIVETIWRRPSERAFVAGLLHDLGTLVLLNEVGEDYGDFLAEAREDGAEINSLENQVLGFEHIVLSARLLSHWGLPEDLTQAIGMPLEADRLAKLPDSCSELPQVLHLADLTARFLTKRDPSLLRELMQTAKRYHNATAIHIEGVVESVAATQPALLQIFGEAPCDEDFLKILHEAKQQIELNDDPLVEREFWDHDRPCFHKLIARAEEMLVCLDAEEETSGDFARAASLGASAEPIRRRDPSGFGKRFAQLTSDTDEALDEAAVAVVENEFDEIAVSKRLERWLNRSRCNNVPVALILIEINLACVSSGLREATAQRIDRFVAATLRGAAARVTVDGAIYVAAMDRMEAIEAAKGIMRRLEADSHCHLAMTKFGVAAIDHPPPNYPAHEWLDAARRCLYAAQSVGGNVVKSIDAV